MNKNDISNLFIFKFMRYNYFFKLSFFIFFYYLLIIYFYINDKKIII